MLIKCVIITNLSKLKQREIMHSVEKCIMILAYDRVVTGTVAETREANSCTSLLNQKASELQ